MTHQYGDAPVEERYREQMIALAKAIDILFNGEKSGPAREVGFILLVFPFGDGDGRCNYISNGAKREDVAKLLREQAAKFEVDINKDTDHA